MNQPIVITGCQRSGTTLLNLILDSHPEVHGVDELEFRAERFQAYLRDPRFSPWVCFKLPTAAHEIKGMATVPGVRVLYCQRDPRDVAASMLKLQIRHGAVLVPWAAHPLGADREIVNGVKLLPAAVREELKPKLEDYGRCRKRNPAGWSRADQMLAAALCWRIKAELFPLYAAAKLTTWLVLYERLLADPGCEIRQLLDFLGLPWHDDVLRHHQLHHGLSVGNTVNDRPIDPGNVGKWRKSLNDSDLAILREICGPAASLGYEL